MMRMRGLVKLAEKVVLLLIVTFSIQASAEVPCQNYNDRFQQIGVVNVPAESWDDIGYTDVKVKGLLAYAFQKYRGFQILDIGDPSAPVHCDMYTLYSYEEGQIAAIDHFVLLATGDQFRIFDVEDQYDIQLVGLFGELAQVHDVVVRFRKAWVAAGHDDLVCLDVDDPVNPSIVHAVPMEGMAIRLAMAGDLLIVATRTPDRLVVVDPDGLMGPSVVGEVDIPGVAKDLAAVGTLAACSHWGGDCELVSLVDPTSPGIVHSFGVFLHGLTFDGNLLYGGGELQAPSKGLHVYDVSSPTQPVHLLYEPMWGWVGAADPAHGLIYVGEEGNWIQGTYWCGFHVFSPGDLTEATSLGGIVDLDNARILACGNDYVAVGHPEALTVVDASNPMEPLVVGTSSRGARALAWYGEDLLVTAGFESSFDVYSISDTGTPEVRDLVPLAGANPTDIAVVGDYAYLAPWSPTGGVGIVDLSGSQPELLEPLWTGAAVGEVEVLGDVAVFSIPPDLVVVDVSDPTAPYELGRHPTEPVEHGLQLLNMGTSTVLLVCSELPIPDFNTRTAWKAYDLSNPHQPTILFRQPLPFYEEMHAVWWDDGVVYSAGDIAIYIDRYWPGLPPERLGILHGGSHALCTTDGSDVLISLAGPAYLNGTPAYDLTCWARQCSNLTSVSEQDVSLSRLGLNAVPNPFNPTTTIRYEVPITGPVRLQIFDLRGRLISTLLEKTVSAGWHEIIWNGRDLGGRHVPSGVYLSRLETSSDVAHGRMTLVR